jgi:hypothetical protein
VTPERPRYDPSFDSGLCIEIMAMWPLQMPDAVWEAPEPRAPAPGALARVVRRRFLVRDLDWTLAVLSSNLDLEPSGTVESFPTLGFRRGRIGFTLPHSATLDLIEPTRWSSDPGRYLHSWGPGPYSIQISVSGLDAKAEQLRADGIRFTAVEADESGPEHIVIDPAELGGLLVELVEH